MKRLFFSILIFYAFLSLSGCPGTVPENENSFGYLVELNIKNETAVTASACVEAYTLYDKDNVALKLYDCDSLFIQSGSEKKLTLRIENSLCASPHLSHIIQINGKNFSGFNTESIKLQLEDSSSPVSISSLKMNLGSVDWTKDVQPVLLYEGKSFKLSKRNSEVKNIYEIIIKNENDISGSEMADYTEGIKISVNHTLSNS